MAFCNCNVTLGNTGTPSCQALIDVTKRMVLVPLLANDGTKNRISVTTLPSNSDILDLINQADPSKRYYPLPDFENVEDVRGDSIVEEANSGNAYKVKNAPRTFTGFLFEQGTTYANQIEAFGCSAVGAFLIDANGSLIGVKSFDSAGLPDYLEPIPIKRGTWDTKYVATTDTTVSKVQIGFTFSDNVDDGDIGFISAGDFAADVDWLDYNGLIDVDGRNGSADSAAGTASIKLVNQFGSFAEPQVVSGLQLADFNLYNKTQTALVTLTGVSESSGTYTLSWTAGAVVATSDVLEVRVVAQGYDDQLLNSRTITAS